MIILPSLGSIGNLASIRPSGVNSSLESNALISVNKITNLYNQMKCYKHSHCSEFPWQHIYLQVLVFPV